MKYAVSTTVLTLVLRFAVLLMGVSCGYAAADDTDASKSDEPAKSDSADKLICKREAVMGSNIKKKTCKTQRQIDEERQASQGMMDDLSRQQGRNNGSGG
jgi:hypothetical protein